MSKHFITSAIVALATISMPAAGAGLASVVMAGLSSSHAQARTVCTPGRYTWRCADSEPPIAPKPGPQGQKTK